MDCSPPRLLHSWDLPGKNTGVGCYFLLQDIFLAQGLNLGLLHCRQTLYHLRHLDIYCIVLSSVMSGFETPWTAACQAPLSMGFSRQDSWSGVSFPPPGDLPDPGIELMSPESPALAGRFFIIVPPGKSTWIYRFLLSVFSTMFSNV